MSSDNKDPVALRLQSITQTILIILLVVAAFFIGSLTTKVQFLEKGIKTGNVSGTSGTTGNAQAQARPFAEYLKDYAKELKLSDKKLLECVNSGSKKALVDADLSQGNSFGVSGTPGFFVNGRFLGGAYPFEAFKELIDKEIEGTASTDPKTYSDFLQKAFNQGSFNPVPQSVDIGNASVKGNANAQITILEFSDFQCPFCKRVTPTVDQILKEYEGKVRFAYKHFPLNNIHPLAQKAAEASECAKDQGKFWEFHDKLFQAQEEWSNST